MKQAEQLAKLYKAGSGSHALFAPLRSPRRQDLTPETFGALLALSWAAEKGPSDLPDPTKLAEEFLNTRDQLPEYAQDVMHVERRVLGSPDIAEYSEYMAGAQDAGLIKRYNPSHIRCHVVIGQLEAKDMLRNYESAYPDLLKWFRDRMSRL